MTASDIQVFALPPASAHARRRMLRKHLFGLLRSSGSPIILDLSGREGLNHEDIDFLLDCAARLGGRDVRLLVVAGSDSNRVLLEVTRIASVLPVFNSIADALDDPKRLARQPAQTAQTALQNESPLPRSA